MNNALVIFLHGVGSCGADFAPLTQLWQRHWPQAKFATPDAPFSFPYNAGFQWFDITGVTEANRISRIEAARASFDDVINRIMAQQGFADQPEHVVLVGFSQGSIMALDCVASGRSRYGAIVAFSGRLALPGKPHFTRNTPVALIHGSDDTVIPCDESVLTETILKTADVPCELHVVPGLGHSLSNEGVALARDFIERTLK